MCLTEWKDSVYALNFNAGVTELTLLFLQHNSSGTFYKLLG